MGKREMWRDGKMRDGGERKRAKGATKRWNMKGGRGGRREGKTGEGREGESG